MASISISKKSDIQYSAKVNVTKEEQEAAEKKAMQKIGQKKKIPGFRKGKVPEHILRSKFEAEIADETLQTTLHEQLPEIAKESENGLYQIVKIDNLKLKKEAYSFELIFDCMPYVKLGKLKGVDLREHIADIKDEDIDREIRMMQRRHAEMNEKPVQTVENGNLVVVDYEIWVNDIPQGNPMLGQQFIVGEGELDKEVEAELLNGPKKAGDEFTLKKEMSAEEQARQKETLKEGQEAATHYNLIVKVKEVKSVKFPELNEEFITKIDKNIKTVDELKENTRKDLEKSFHRRSMDEQIAKAIDTVLEGSKVYYPENYMTERMQKYLGERKIELEQMPEKDKEEFETGFVTQQKRRLLVEHIISEASNDKKGDSQYREKLHDFLAEEFNPEMAQAMLMAYDQMLGGRQLDQTSSYLIERALGQFHQNLIEDFFKQQGLVKKGKKMPLAEVLKK